MEQSVHERIRERAYHLWDLGGRVEDQAQQHWLSAEREILAERSTQPADASPAVAPASRPRGRKALKNGRTG
jgi:hypothetical protein